MIDAQTISDKLEIADLVARYGHAVNRADFQGWADCFARDGVFGGAFERYSAHRDLDRFTAEARQLMERWPNLRLHFTNVVSETSGDRATARSLLTMTSTSDARTWIVFVAEYHDQLVREGGRWVFAERVVHVVGP